MNTNIPKDCGIDHFVNALKDELSVLFGEGYTVTTRRQLKNNSVYLTGITVNKEGSEVAPSLYVDDYYKRFAHGMDLERIIRDLYETLKDAADKPGFDMEKVDCDPSQMREDIIFKLVNTERNKELLKMVPHRDFLDLSVTYHRFIAMGNKALGSVLITNELAKSYSFTEEELFELAQKNTPKFFSLLVRPLCDTLADLSGIPVASLPEEFRTGSEFPLYVISNTRYTNGASCLLYPGLKSKIASLIDGDFYIIPSSIHELILLPTGGDPDFFISMLREVNETQVPKEDVLSDNLYHYSAVTGEFSYLSKRSAIA